jgi:hypothetical protein
MYLGATIRHTVTDKMHEEDVHKGKAIPVTGRGGP